jgi:hypothetical protein
VIFYQPDPNTGQIAPYSIAYYTHHPDGRYDHRFIEYYDYTVQGWFPSWAYQYTYKPDNTIDTLFKYDNSASVPIPSETEYSVIDGAGRLTGTVTEFFDTASGHYETAHRTRLEYLTQTSAIQSKWLDVRDNASGSFNQIDRHDYYYPAGTGTTEFNNAFEFTAFPNPTSSNLNMVLPRNIRFIEIRNLQGQVVYTGTPESQISMESFPAGLYLITIFSADGQPHSKPIAKIN